MQSKLEIVRQWRPATGDEGNKPVSQEIEDELDSENGSEEDVQLKSEG